MLRDLAAGVSLLVLSCPALAGTLAEDAKAFGTREHVQYVTLSADGSKLAMITAGPAAESYLVVADLNSGQMTNLTKSDGKPQSLRWCNFAGTAQLVCYNSGIERYDSSLIHFSGLFAISADGKSMRSLRPNGRSEGSLRQSDGHVIDWLPGSNGSVLMARNYIADGNTTGTLLSRSAQGLGVDRIDLASMKISKVEPPREGAFSYLTDRRGNVRLTMSEADDKRGLLTGVNRIQYRAKNSRDWRALGTYDARSRDGWLPLSIDSDADALFALKKVDGRMALYRVALDGSGTSTLVGKHPQVDVDEVVTLGPGQKIIGYTFADERRQTVYFDPEYDRLQSALAKALPRQPLISFHGATADGQKVLVLASGDAHAGTFYRYDKTTKQLGEIAQVRPETAGRQLATMKAISFPAPDGANVPAYLTIPAGSNGKNLPTVVLPHGGPSARDEWGFDWLAQFFAARGYAVIQPNFRGSDGYGDDWLVENGFKGWRTSIGDVTAAAKYLIAQGVADPKKVVIVGWSYGGYAALQSAAVEPRLYKAAVAIAPVTDLAMVRKEAQGFTSERLVKDFVGTGPHLVEGSPLRNVSSIQIPVLLVHGDRDANVAVAQSARMHAALLGAGKKSELLRFDNLDHQIDDSDARIRMLTRIGEFLQASMGQ